VSVALGGHEINDLCQKVVFPTLSSFSALVVQAHHLFLNRQVEVPPHVISLYQIKSGQMQQ
jgi:hypothetical protein